MRLALIIGRNVDKNSGWQVLQNTQGDYRQAVMQRNDMLTSDGWKGFPPEDLVVVRLPRRVMWDRFAHDLKRLPPFWLHSARKEDFMRRWA